MNAEMVVGTNKKAFQINLDAKKYGTFAEIGAGQEVARRFFHVGGASGTVAKTMSAYDMTFSDAIYGPADRYVSRKRLQTMLDHEYALLVERLDAKFGSERTFFVFADTVAARSFKQHNESHGWLGVRFQTETRGEPIVVSESPLLITAVPEGGTLIPNLDNQIFILTSYPDGKPARADVALLAVVWSWLCLLCLPWLFFLLLGKILLCIAGPRIGHTRRGVRHLRVHHSP
jgi:hypothetical protein